MIYQALSILSFVYCRGELKLSGMSGIQEFRQLGIYSACIQVTTHNLDIESHRPRLEPET